MDTFHQKPLSRGFGTHIGGGEKKCEIQWKSEFPFMSTLSETHPDIAKRLTELAAVCIKHSPFGKTASKRYGLWLFCESIVEVVADRCHQCFLVRSGILDKKCGDGETNRCSDANGKNEHANEKRECCRIKDTTEIAKIVDECIRSVSARPGKTLRPADVIIPSPASALLAGQWDDAYFSFDVDGIWGMCARAHDVGSTRTAPCARTAPGSFTCTPETALTNATIDRLHVPECLAKRYEGWNMPARRDAKREERIEATFRKPTEGGTSVSNIIATGFCGGIPSYKKKKKKPRDGEVDVAAAIVGPTQRQHGSAPMSPTYPEREESVWFLGGPLAGVGCDVYFATADGSESCSTTTHMSTIGSVRAREMLPEEHDIADLAVVAGAAAMRNPWIDAANMTRFGSVWTAETMPCGCIGEIVQCAVISSRKALAVERCKTQKPPKRLDVWSLSEFVLCSMAGILTDEMVLSAPTTSVMAQNTNLLLTAATYAATDMRMLSKTAGNMHGERKSGVPDVHSWGRALSVETEELARCALGPSYPVSTWYNTSFRKLSHVHEAVDAALAADLPLCADAIACAVSASEITKIKSNGSAVPIPKAKNTYLIREDGTRVIVGNNRTGDANLGNVDATIIQRGFQTMGLLFDNNCTTWPCDVAWTTSLAAEMCGGDNTARTCGYVLPLKGRASTVVFGTEMRDGAGTECCAECSGRGDPSDALVFGALCTRIGARTNNVEADCGMFYPFVFMVVTCACRARETDDAYWNEKRRYGLCDGGESKNTRDGRSGWDVLLRAAVCWFSDHDRITSISTDSQPRPSELPAWHDSTVPKFETDPGFQALRLFGRILFLYCSINEERAESHQKYQKSTDGLWCLARPTRCWRIDGDCAAVLLKSPAVENVGRITREWLEAATQRRHITIDRETRTLVNVGTAILGATDPTTAVAFVSGVHLDDTDLDTEPRRGLLKTYDPLEGYLRCIDGGLTSGWGIKRRCDGCAHVHRRRTAGWNTIPNLSKLSSEFVASVADANDLEVRTSDRVLEMLWHMEHRATQKHRSESIIEPTASNAIDKKGKPITTMELKAACVVASRKKGIPYCVMECDGTILDTSDRIPIASHPLALIGATPVTCGACGTAHVGEKAATSHNDNMPPKDGPLMRLLTLARHGMIVVPHAFPVAVEREGGSSAEGNGTGEWHATDFPVSLMRDFVKRERTKRSPRTVIASVPGTSDALEHPSKLVGLFDDVFRTEEDAKEQAISNIGERAKMRSGDTLEECMFAPSIKRKQPIPGNVIIQKRSFDAGLSDSQTTTNEGNHTDCSIQTKRRCVDSLQQQHPISLTATEPPPTTTVTEQKQPSSIEDRLASCVHSRTVPDWFQTLVYDSNNITRKKDNEDVSM